MAFQTKVDDTCGVPDQKVGGRGEACKSAAVCVTHQPGVSGDLRQFANLLTYVKKLTVVTLVTYLIGVAYTSTFGKYEKPK